MNKISKILSVLFIVLALTIILISPTQAATTETPITEKIQSSSNLSQEKLQDKVEQEKSKAEEKAEDTLVSEAQEAVQETQKAIASIEKGNKQDALKALELATGKLDLVLARQPELGFVPLESKVDIISLAPSDLDAVKKIRKQVKQAIRKDELVKARALLDNLASELRITTVNLPLATYPVAMQEAAQLLDRDEFEQAKGILQTALSTLFVAEKQSPLPVIKAQALIDEADSLIQIDGHEEIVQSLLAEARNELKLAEELGYGDRDREYALLDDAIKNIKQQITAGDRAEIAFSNLKDKLGSFFDRISS
jgi:YfdX protein